MIDISTRLEGLASEVRANLVALGAGPQALAEFERRFERVKQNVLDITAQRMKEWTAILEQELTAAFEAEFSQAKKH